MIRVFSVVTSLLICMSSFANDDDLNYESFREVIDVSDLNPSPLDMKKAILQAMLDMNWKILQHKENTILAKYKGKSVFKATLDGQTITIKEVESQYVFQQKWLDNLRHHFVKNITYFYHVKKLNRYSLYQLTSRPVRNKLAFLDHNYF
ncbi:MAG: hypothetical protein V3W04_09060 [Gammaproteobacteria bacterium]